MQNRLVAEIPDLPPSWKITFDLKLTGHPKKCCTRWHCANGILSMGHLLIAYSCANRRNVWVSYPVPHMKQEWAPGYPQRENAVIRIAQMINGKYVVEDKKKKLLIGHWTKFEISQLTENYNNKNRLMFKVNLIKLKFSGRTLPNRQIVEYLIFCHILLLGFKYGQVGYP